MQNVFMQPRNSFSSEPKKPHTSQTMRTTQLNTPTKCSPELRKQITFTSVQDKQLNLFRRIFNPSPSRPLSQKHDLKIESTKRQLSNYEFPDWLSNIQRFQELKTSDQFNFATKVIYICKIEYFKRSDDQKEIIVDYLRKLTFFRLMPQNMLFQIAGRILYKKYSKGQIICTKGEQGDCLYIIHKGQVIDMEKAAYYGPDTVLGRQALENDAVRNITLKCTQDCDIITLNRMDYSIILQNIMEIESRKQEQFVKTLPLFQHFNDDKIRKFCAMLQGKYLTPQDVLYSAGDTVDNFYILKQGLLVKKVVMDLEDQNRWPIAQKKWKSKTITKTVNLEIEYKPSSLIGYYDIIESEYDMEKKRIESIESKEDCYLLYITRTQFFQIFSSGDIKYFINYHLTHNPMSFEQLVKSTRYKEKIAKQQYQTINNALSNHLNQFAYDYNTLQRKVSKYDKVVQNTKNKFETFKKQLKILKIGQVTKVLTSQYE
ncbi:hypothetical protein pb186bvf_006204 [Paramecium bursaria]